MKDKYVKIDVVSSFRQRYVIPYEALQELNEDVPLTEELAHQWAEEQVMMEEVKEFSQKWIGENVIDVDTINTVEGLRLFRKENKELSKEWNDARQLKYLNDWKDPLKDKIQQARDEEGRNSRTDTEFTS